FAPATVDTKMVWRLLLGATAVVRLGFAAEATWVWPISYASRSGCQSPAFWAFAARGTRPMMPTHKTTKKRKKFHNAEKNSSIFDRCAMFLRPFSGFDV